MRATLRVTRGPLLAALMCIATAWDMPSYVKRVTRPYRKALIGSYRGMRSALRDRLPPGAARRADHIFDHFDLYMLDHGFIRAIYPNRHRLAPDVWRSSQPAPHDIALFARQGIRTIVNLRGARDCGSYRLERASCQQYGIKLIDFPTKSREAPSAIFFREAAALFDGIDYPMLMHCKAGADRVGLMSVLYLILAEACPPEQAIKELSLRYGHIKQARTGVLDAVVQAYIRHASLEPVDFLKWTETHYDAQAVTADFRPRSWANTLVDGIRCRE
jgi:protein tyrosine phosphatase (PTP) superfamily phosphohydrolase (DUF442 family)